jgi:DNA-binding transcriptional MerR regulator
MGAQESEVCMSTHKPKTIEGCLQQIREALEHKPDREVLEKWSNEVLFKLGEIHEEVSELERDLAYVTDQVDELQS